MKRSILVCMPVARADPSVESEERWCTICAEPVWISLNALGLDADPVCQDCAIGIPGFDEAPIDIPPEVRETLHAKGFTDEKIADVVKHAKRLMKRERES